MPKHPGEWIEYRPDQTRLIRENNLFVEFGSSISDRIASHDEFWRLGSRFRRSSSREDTLSWLKSCATSGRLPADDHPKISGGYFTYGLGLPEVVTRFRMPGRAHFIANGSQPSKEHMKFLIRLGAGFGWDTPIGIVADFLEERGFSLLVTLGRYFELYAEEGVGRRYLLQRLGR